MTKETAMSVQDHYYYAWRRSDGYVAASKGGSWKRDGGQDSFQLLAKNTDWETIRAVVLVERVNPRIDESGRYSLHLTETPWRYPWSKGPIQRDTRTWTINGAELRAKLWTYATGKHEDLGKEGGYFDEAGYVPGSSNFYLRGCTKGGDLELLVIPVP